MLKNLLLENVGTVKNIFSLPENIKSLETNISNYPQISSIYSYENPFNLDSIWHIYANSHSDFKSIGFHYTQVAPLHGENDIIFGQGISLASSTATASAQSESILYGLSVNNVTSDAVADGFVEAIGINNTGQINTERGDDVIIGIATASVSGTATASSRAKLESDHVFVADANSESLAEVDLVAEAVGITNSGQINTGRGNDIILGIASASASGIASADSQAQLDFSNDSQAIANSESFVLLDTLAIGIDNTGTIETRSGDDVIVGLSSNSAMSEAEATAIAANTTALAFDGDDQAMSEAETAISNSLSTAITDNRTTTLGLANVGEINTGYGHDVIIGLANNQSSSQSQTTSNAESTANDVAISTADANSLAIAQSNTVGIANFGRIFTSKGNDLILGIAIDQTTANADADADALATAEDSDAQTNTDAIADTLGGVTIGIDNTSGRISTAAGNDQIMGIGAVGILGGRLHTNSGHDRLLGYGSTVGVENATVRLGYGDDYFQAAIADFDSLTGETSFSEDQSSSIKNADVFGNRGNDTFEIGGFAGTVAIDGGRDFDTLRLWGNVEDYQFTVSSSDSSALTIEDSGSILTVKNVEAIYLGDSSHALNIDNIA